MKNNKKKIIFLAPHLPAADFPEKFFVDAILTNGFDIEYWNIGSLLGYGKVMPYSVTNIPFSNISNHLHLWKRLRETQAAHTVYVPQITRSIHTIPLEILLRILRKKSVFFGRGYLPFVSQPFKGTRYILDRLKEPLGLFFLSRRLLSLVILRVFCAMYKYDIAFTAGALAERIHSKDSKVLVPIHHFDVDRLQYSQTNSIPGSFRNSIVFLDDNFPYHPDFLMVKKNTINPGLYYDILNSFFADIEERTGLGVVIAAHPRANYNHNPFNGRPLIYYKTELLVREAALVLAHASTAISFAIIHEKPLCLLYTNDIQRTHPHEFCLIKKTSEILGCPFLNAEEVYLYDTNFPKVNEEKYRAYYKEFISNLPESIISRDIVLKHINALLAVDSLS